MNYCIFDKKKYIIVLSGFESNTEAANTMCQIIQTRRTVDEQHGVTPIPVDKPELVVLPNEQNVFEYIYNGMNESNRKKKSLFCCFCTHYNKHNGACKITNFYSPNQLACSSFRFEK